MLSRPRSLAPRRTSYPDPERTQGGPSPTGAGPARFLADRSNCTAFARSIGKLLEQDSSLVPAASAALHAYELAGDEDRIGDHLGSEVETDIRSCQRTRQVQSHAGQ